MIKEKLYINFNEIIDLDQMFEKLGDSVSEYKNNEPKLFEFIERLSENKDFKLTQEDGYLSAIGSSLFTGSPSNALNYATYEESDLQSNISEGISDSEHYNERGFMNLYIKYNEKWFELNSNYYTSDYSVQVSPFDDLNTVTLIDQDKYDVHIKDISIEEKNRSIADTGNNIYDPFIKSEGVEALKELLYQTIDDEDFKLPENFKLEKVMFKFIALNSLSLKIRNIGSFDIAMYEHGKEKGKFLLSVNKKYFKVVEDLDRANDFK